MATRLQAHRARGVCSAKNEQLGRIVRRLMVPMLITSAFGIALCAALPDGTTVSLGLGDKVDHFAAFAVLAAVCTTALPSLALGYLQGAMIAFGASIELVQTIPSLQRQSDAKDLLADAAGSAVVLALVYLWRKYGRVMARKGGNPSGMCRKIGRRITPLYGTD